MVWYDYYYFILVVPALIISLIAQAKVKSTYAKMSRVLCSRGLTGAQAAENVLRYYGITDVRIEQVAGSLTDHYDPRSNVIRLSEGVYHANSVAAVGIACHEAGHAAQHAENYKPIAVRNAVLPVANIGSASGLWIALLGLAMNVRIMILIGIILYAFVAIFQLVTLPVEFNASSRALKVIEETNMLQGEEFQGAKKVLSAAAMTYVAALLVSIMSLLRVLLRAKGGGRRR
ncbi:MAG: zinc metallopeptidase [Clostridia bacterium]|nr:zinc metallopeptidase [Clostridia bacterium]